MKMQRNLTTTLIGAAMAVAISTSTAAAFMVESNAPAKPPGQYLETNFTAIVNNVLTVDNIRRPEWTKSLWMEVTLDTMSGYPQAPGEEVRLDLWPTVSAPGSESIITGAASVGYDNTSGPWKWYLTATIEPQPAYETITFPSVWGIEKVYVYTACVPEPSTCVLTILGVTACIIMRHRRKNVR